MAETEELTYRRWSCDKLLGMIDDERGRLDTILTRARTQVAGLAVLLGLVSGLRGDLDPFSLGWWFLLAGFVATIVAFVRLLDVEKLEEFEAIRAKQFIDESVLECSLDERYWGVAQAAREVIEANGPRINNVGVKARRTQKAVLVAVAFVLGGFVLGVL